ncbi:MAG: restriction endonuclease subunit S [Burkholderiales bacterium]|nr:restriction endonuclease subunit S [Burkholderiales bacterium]
MTTATLESISKLISSGGTPSRKNPEYYATGTDGHLWVKSKELLDCAIDTTEERISDDGLNNSSAKYYPANTVLIAMYGANVGQLGWLRKPATVNQAICGLVIDDQKADWRFIFYALLLNRGDLTVQAQGAAQQNLNQEMIRKFSIAVPPLPLQRRIAGILSAYDELIENSQRRSRILETMARALYREWFVHFRFPGHEHVPRVPSPLGEIPQGWEVTTVGDTLDISGGGTPSRKNEEYWDGGTIQWYSPSDLTGAGTMFMDDSGDHITELGLAKSSAKLFPANSIMLTSRATIGAIAINTQPACTNQGFITCMPNERVPLCFLFHWLTENVPVFQRMASGATFKEISRGVFKTIDFLLPPRGLVDRFEAIAAPLAGQMLALQRQIQTLRRTRDLLLPRLLSGQIDVEMLAA